MKNIGKNVIELILKCILINDLNALRQCSKYLSIIIGRIYFNKVCIYGYKLLDYNFRYFCWKYKPVLYIKNIYNIKQLIFSEFYTNLKSVEINCKIMFYYNIPNVYKLKLICNGDKSKHSIIIPSTVKKLYIHGSYNKQIKIYNPTKVNERKLKVKYNNCLVLPSTLIKLVINTNELKIEKGFNQPIDELPESLTDLDFSSNYVYDQPLKKYGLPLLLKKICFGNLFNSSIKKNILPPTLVKIDFGSLFNKPLKQGILPQSLEKLIFGWHYNQEILQGVLPKSLIKLDLGHDFDHDLKDILPTSLRKLTISGCYSHSVNYLMLDSLEKLKFGMHYCERIYDLVLPPNLKTLILSECFDEKITGDFFPLGLTELNFGFDFNRELSEGLLPESLIKLTLGPFYDCPIRKYVLPSNLQIFKTYSNDIKRISLPKSIKKIKQCSYNKYGKLETNVINLF